jgi:phytanoyl-CoA hydroxylase
VTMLSVDSTSFDSASALAEFAKLGYARLGRVLDDESIASLGQRVDDLMFARVRHEGLFFQHDANTGRYEDLQFGLGWQGASASYRKIEKLERDPLFRAWIENPLFERIARAHIEGPIALYRAVLFTKAATGGTALPWHQDGGVFWGIDRAPSLQIWTALDDAPIDAGCVEVIPGSHLRGLATPQGGVIADALVQDQLDRVVALPARAGEAILIHNQLWHRSHVNTTGKRRSALSICYMSAATRCLRKRGAPREFVRLFSESGA